MAKQTNYTKTQVRMENSLHELLRDYADKKGMSLNEAMTTFISDGLLEDVTSENTVSNKNVYIHAINNNLKDFTTQEVKQIMQLTLLIAQLKGQ